MTPEIKGMIAEVINYVLETEEESYEECLRDVGSNHALVADHIYNVARNLWAELELDHTGGNQ